MLLSAILLDMIKMDTNLITKLKEESEWRKEINKTTYFVRFTIKNKENKYLLVLDNEKQHWSFPIEQVKENENTFDTLKRVLRKTFNVEVKTVKRLYSDCSDDTEYFCDSKKSCLCDLFSITVEEDYNKTKTLENIPCVWLPFEKLLTEPLSWEVTSWATNTISTLKFASAILKNKDFLNETIDRVDECYKVNKEI